MGFNPVTWGDSGTKQFSYLTLGHYRKMPGSVMHSTDVDIKTEV